MWWRQSLADALRKLVKIGLCYSVLRSPRLPAYTHQSTSYQALPQIKHVQSTTIRTLLTIVSGNQTQTVSACWLYAEHQSLLSALCLMSGAVVNMCLPIACRNTCMRSIVLHTAARNVVSYFKEEVCTRSSRVYLKCVQSNHCPVTERAVGCYSWHMGLRGSAAAVARPPRRRPWQVCTRAEPQAGAASPRQLGAEGASSGAYEHAQLAAVAARDAQVGIQEDDLACQWDLVTFMYQPGSNSISAVMLECTVSHKVCTVGHQTQHVQSTCQ